MQQTEALDSVAFDHYVYVGSSESIEEGEMVECAVGTETVVVSRVNGKVYAVEGICTHAYSELIDGELDGTCLTCPLHFACFDIRDGAVLEGPADTPLKTYEVTESNGSVWIII